MQKQKKFFAKIQGFVFENKFFCLLFFLSLIFFIWQHYLHVSWDFAAYALNAKHIFLTPGYFEPFRPPLVPLLVGFFSVFGLKAAEFFFIIFVSIVFAYSSFKFAKTLGFNPLIFYALSLNFYTLNYGLLVGTELLSVALIELSIVMIAKKNSLAGFFVGLAGLTRYHLLGLGSLLFFQVNPKNILKSIILFCATIFVWLAINYLVLGNFFASIADSYALNFVSRQYMDYPMQLAHFAVAQNILIPFFLLGIGFSLHSVWKNLMNNKKIFEKLEGARINLLMFFLLGYSIYSYAVTPWKDPRYLFTILLPTVYFAYTGLNFVAKKAGIRRLALVVSLTLFAASYVSAIFVFSNFVEDVSRHQEAAQELESLRLNNCKVLSNSWVYMNYFGIPTTPFPNKNVIQKRISEGTILVMFQRIGEPLYAEDANFMDSLPALSKGKDYYIIGDGNCIPPERLDRTYLEMESERVLESWGEQINTDYCSILFHNKLFLEPLCNFVNGA
jgi:hypothetical protein